MPDYQGIGLGTSFLTQIAQYYKSKGYDFSIVTSAKNMISTLNNRAEWVLTRYSSNVHPDVKKGIGYGYHGLGKSMRSNCKVASFYYKGNK